MQYKKREKHPWGSLASNTPPWMFFTFFKCVQLLRNRAKYFIHPLSLGKHYEERMLASPSLAKTAPLL